MEANLEDEERRVANFVEFIGEGRGSRALAEALAVSERRRDELRAELKLLRRSQEAVSSVPPLLWIQERVAVLQEVLERRTERSALLLRALLGKARLEPVTREGGRSYYRAISNLQVLALLDVGTTPEGPDPGSTSLQWWTRSQRIRTAGEIPFQAVLFESSVPVFQSIAQQAKHLRTLGLSVSRIAHHLGVTDKTVARSLAWIAAKAWTPGTSA